MTTAIYQPVVTINEDEAIETDWFQSYVGTVDDDGNEVLDDEPRDEVLDARLDAIRDLLDGNTSKLANLVRPFFTTT